VLWSCPQGSKNLRVAQCLRITQFWNAQES
jgi:hypothetical protein